MIFVRRGTENFSVASFFHNEKSSPWTSTKPNPIMTLPYATFCLHCSSYGSNSRKCPVEKITKLASYRVHMRLRIAKTFPPANFPEHKFYRVLIWLHFNRFWFTKRDARRFRSVLIRRQARNFQREEVSAEKVQKPRNESKKNS